MSVSAPGVEEQRSVTSLNSSTRSRLALTNIAHLRTHNAADAHPCYDSSSISFFGRTSCCNRTSFEGCDPGNGICQEYFNWLFCLLGECALWLFIHLPYSFLLDLSLPYFAHTNAAKGSFRGVHDAPFVKELLEFLGLLVNDIIIGP